MGVKKGFNLTPTTTNLAHHKHEETKHYKKNDGIIRLHQMMHKNAFKSQFPSLF